MVTFVYKSQIYSLNLAGYPSREQKREAFERLVRAHFAEGPCRPVSIRAIQLSRHFAVQIGYTKEESKGKIFNLRLEDPPMLIECKADSWTRGGNVSRGKFQGWNEAMLYFLLAPERYRKVLCVARAFSEKKGETLGEYYVRNYRHLIPPGVSVIEIDGPSARLLVQMRDCTFAPTPIERYHFMIPSFGNRL